MSLIPNVGTFYKRPIEQTNSNNCTLRFSTQVIGVNKLSTYVKCMSKDAGINVDNKNISNHSGKVTCATTLYNHGFDKKAVSGRSGHRSDAIETYKRPSEQMLNEVAMALQPARPDVNKENRNVVSNCQEDSTYVIATCALIFASQGLRFGSPFSPPLADLEYILRIRALIFHWLRLPVHVSNQKTFYTEHMLSTKCKQRCHFPFWFQ